MLSIGFPSNSKLFFSLIIDLANLKIISIDYLLENIMGLKQKATKESSGYSENLFESMGLLLVGVVLVLFFMATAFLVYKVFNKSTLVKKIFKFLADKIVFNTCIRTFIAGDLVFSISAFRNT
jgi:hypothetical protein